MDLHGPAWTCIITITIDAMGCQKGIARQIVVGGSDYLLAVKSNQGELYGKIKDVFECAAREGTLEWNIVTISRSTRAMEEKIAKV